MLEELSGRQHLWRYGQTTFQIGNLLQTETDDVLVGTFLQTEQILVAPFSIKANLESQTHVPPCIKA